MLVLLRRRAFGETRLALLLLARPRPGLYRLGLHRPVLISWPPCLCSPRCRYSAKTNFREIYHRFLLISRNNSPKSHLSPRSFASPAMLLARYTLSYRKSRFFLIYSARSVPTRCFAPGIEIFRLSLDSRCPATNGQGVERSLWVLDSLEPSVG